MKAQAAVSADQRSAEHLRLVVGERSRKTACDFLLAEQRTDKGIRKIGVLVGGKLPFPGPIADGVRTNRQKIWPAADQLTIPITPLSRPLTPSSMWMWME